MSIALQKYEDEVKKLSVVVVWSHYNQAHTFSLKETNTAQQQTT